MYRDFGLDFGLVVDGAWRPAAAGMEAEVVSPVSERPFGRVPVASEADTLEALGSAERGFAAWRAFGDFAHADALHAIADAMRERAEEAVRMISAETGRPLAQSGREWDLAPIRSAGAPRRRGASTAASSRAACPAAASRC